MMPKSHLARTGLLSSAPGWASPHVCQGGGHPILTNVQYEAFR